MSEYLHYQVNDRVMVVDNGEIDGNGYEGEFGYITSIVYTHAVDWCYEVRLDSGEVAYFWDEQLY